MKKSKNKAKVVPDLPPKKGLVLPWFPDLGGSIPLEPASLDLGSDQVGQVLSSEKAAPIIEQV